MAAETGGDVISACGEVSSMLASQMCMQPVAEACNVSRVELDDMHLGYGVASTNARQAVDLYRLRYLARRRTLLCDIPTTPSEAEE
ncbi:hypothetical protein PR048_013895 [Dryococelus australis]|uniref:Uncharacterized protein n=1 Tax=Dryococelus australis TaxID=614101 RepID=A0ABQ9HTX2_9NEOP|nr:hypothetical protein PR048_013895 [Dryococelus australis]